jgi:peptide/nickel transport system substrate-binding protein
MLRKLVDNVLSGMKAGFKSSHSYKQTFERKKMFIQKGSSKLSATLLALILGASVFMTGQVWAAKMVKDPTTGKMIKAPQYGGTIAIATNLGEPPHTDTWWGTIHYRAINLVLDKLGMIDWATPRDKWGFMGWYTPFELIKPHLAESFEQPDPLTLIFKIRKGIRWHNKAPMNGRELVAEDIVFNYNRMAGLGGFTEKSPGSAGYTNLPIESITSPDKYTVVFKLKKVSFTARDQIYYDNHETGWIYPPEVIKEHGNVKNWRNLVGTGPYMLTDWLEGSSMTYTKNPDYWKDDEKFPGNRLPYIDEIKILFMADLSTKLSALRTGKIALDRDLGLDEAESLQRTNPELVMTHSIYSKSTTAFAGDVRKPPFSDIRVRQAMQLALDLETINQSLYDGLAYTTPMGIVGKGVLGFYTPFEEWPEDLKANYDYNPARAKKLLAEAGYPDGFKTTLLVDPRWDPNYIQVAKDYWSKIGVDVEIKLTDTPTVSASVNNHSYEGMIGSDMGTDYNGLVFVRIMAYSNEAWNWPGIQDPKYDAIVDAAEGASSYEEMRRLVKKADMYYIKKKWAIWGPRIPKYHFAQPWLSGYNGEYTLGGGQTHTVYSRLWIDQDMKEEMGH